MAKRKRWKRIIILSDSSDSSEDEDLHQTHPKKKPGPRSPRLEDEHGFTTTILSGQPDTPIPSSSSVTGIDVTRANDRTSDDDDDDSQSGESSTPKRISTDTGSPDTSIERDSPITISDSDDESTITPGTAVTDKAPSECAERSTPEERRPLCNIRGCYLKDITSPTSTYTTFFQELKQELVTRLFHFYNRTIFENKLPQDLQITWSKRLKSTGGRCHNVQDGSEHYSIIELSEKVCDSADRVRDTLAHEMCHAACWLIDGDLEAGHGPLWMTYAQKVTCVHPELPKVDIYHSYDINYKFTYQCSWCHHSFGRFRTIAQNKAFCRFCSGRLHLLTTSQNDDLPSTSHHTPSNKTNRENYGPARKAANGLSHQNVIQKISPGASRKRKCPY